MSSRPYPLTTRFQDQLGRLMKKYTGRNGTDGHKPLYIPQCELEEFWTDQKIIQLLGEYQHSSVTNPETITEHFLRIFSLLVFLDLVSYLEIFIKDDLKDERFPMEELPLPSIAATSRQQDLDDIKKWQWAFFPVVLKPTHIYSQTLSSRHVLPICKEDLILRACATVTKIITGTGGVTLVRKTYDENSHDQYSRERSAFESLRRHHSDHIITNYGYYTQCRSDGTITHNLILEYANGGSLEDFYNSKQPPTTTKDIINFWKAFLGLFDGLFHIHHYRADPSNQAYLGIHQDMKPQNILVFNKSSDDEFDIVLKIADFGHSHTMEVDHDDTKMPGIDSHGNQIFGSLECSHHARFTQRGRQSITTEADIFSMGCIISDAASWVYAGTQGRKDYTQLRVTEIDKIEEFKGSGHHGCFHDGIDALKAVGQTHENIKNSIRNDDLITPQILDVVQNNMLIQKPRDRLTAKQLHGKFSRIINTHESPYPPNRVVSQRSNTRDRVEEDQSRRLTEPGPLLAVEETMQPPSHINDPPLPSPGFTEMAKRSNMSQGLDNPGNDFRSESNHAIPSVPMLPLEQARQYYNTMKNRLPLDDSAKQVISSLKGNLRDRDHIFFIDASETMHKHHIDKIYSAFPVLAYFAKLIDTNGVELCFSSNPIKIYCKSTTTSLLECFKTQNWDHFAFEHSFGTFIDQVVTPRLYSRVGAYIPRFMAKPLNILVFTDGRWGKNKDKAAGVENPISRIIKTMAKKHLGRTQVLIQFIRFGDDKDGIRYLTYLDDLGKEVGRDFIDTKPVNGDFYEIFVGALHPDVDD